MAYINELGQTVSCTVSSSEQINNFFTNWQFTLLPLAGLVILFFLLKKYVKNKILLVVYVILSISLYIWWIPKTFIFCI